MLNDKSLTNKYFLFETGHASGILKHSFPSEYANIIEILKKFQLTKKHITDAGKNKSDISKDVDSFLYDKGWSEKKFQINITIDEEAKDIPTHKIDCYKNRVAFEVEWNNKDPFYDRDLNNFRLLHQLNAISVGVIFTRHKDLQKIFDKLGKGKSYGNSTTHHEKLMPKLLSGGAGGCPVLVIAIKPECYVG